MSDWVLIEGLEAEAVIGVYDWERQLRQTLVFDLALATDIRPAAAADDLTLALNYAELAERVRSHAAASSHQLLETLAEEVAALLLRHYPISKLRLTLAKPGAVPQARRVAVRIERERQA